MELGLKVLSLFSWERQKENHGINCRIQLSLAAKRPALALGPWTSIVF